MGIKAAVQALQEADELKDKVVSCADVFNDSEAWTCHQQLQVLYQQVLLLDLEYALDKKVEQDLWNYGFKNLIGTLQSSAKDKKNPRRSESQTILSWFLEAASGFYLMLLQKICTMFDLDLPFRRKASIYGCTPLVVKGEHYSQPHRSSCYYICQHCLVHLGDISRYRNQLRQAESFYRHAVLLAPASGQPYNQLAILEASKGDKLSTVFYYVRSVAVKHPFPAASTNLSKMLSKIVCEDLLLEGKSKVSSTEYISAFLKLHAILHLGSSIDVAHSLVKVLCSSLTALVATESFTAWKLVQMLTINLFALHHTCKITEGEHTQEMEKEVLSEEEQKTCCLVRDLLAGTLSALLLPVYTVKEEESLLEYFALPAVKLILEWICVDPLVLEDVSFTSRMQIWPSLCKLLNGLQLSLTHFSDGQYTDVPLPEDCDLQGFLPVQKMHVGYRFKDYTTWKRPSKEELSCLRASRLTILCQWLANQNITGGKVLTVQNVKNNQDVLQQHQIKIQTQDSIVTVSDESDKLVSSSDKNMPSKGELYFEATGQQAPPSDLIRELEELGLSKEKESSLKPPSPVLSESSMSTGTGKSTPEQELKISLSPREVAVKEEEREVARKDKKTGILKPQGSLERGRDRDKESDKGPENKGGVLLQPPHPGGRKRQNVALQAIMKKGNMSVGFIEEKPKNSEMKQVTFKTPSPATSPIPPPAEGTGSQFLSSDRTQWQTTHPPEKHPSGPGFPVYQQQQQALTSQQQQQQAVTSQQQQQQTLTSQPQQLFVNQMQPQHAFNGTLQQGDSRSGNIVPRITLGLPPGGPAPPNGSSSGPNPGLVGPSAGVPLQLHPSNVPYFQQEASHAVQNVPYRQTGITVGSSRMPGPGIPPPPITRAPSITTAQGDSTGGFNITDQCNTVFRPPPPPQLSLTQRDLAMKDQTEGERKAMPFSPVVGAVRPGNQHSMWQIGDASTPALPHSPGKLPKQDMSAAAGRLNVPPMPPTSWWQETGNRSRRFFPPDVLPPAPSQCNFQGGGEDQQNPGMQVPGQPGNHLQSGFLPGSQQRGPLQSRPGEGNKTAPPPNVPNFRGSEVLGGPLSNPLGPINAWTQAPAVPAGHLQVNHTSSMNLLQLLGQLQQSRLPVGQTSPSPFTPLHRPMQQRMSHHPSNLQQTLTTSDVGSFQEQTERQTSSSVVVGKRPHYEPQSSRMMDSRPAAQKSSSEHSSGFLERDSGKITCGGGENSGYSSGIGSLYTGQTHSSTYSLFSTSSWVTTPSLVTTEGSTVSGSVQNLNTNISVTTGGSLFVQPPLQSFWSGPGPSPLERLLEQQKQQRDGPTPKGGT